MSKTKKKIEKKIEIAGKELVLSTGHIAEQASGAVMASYGETVVMATVVASDARDWPGYFPLSVEYQERLYAGGRIKGSRWVKREGRPNDDEILTGRLIDRSIRPLFPSAYRKDVQVAITVLSVDLENSPDIAAALATSAALALSSIPWSGPVGIVRVGVKDGEYFTNPTESELSFSDMDLIVSSTKDAVVMIEAGASEVDEKVVLGGIEYAYKENKKIISFIEEFAAEVGNKKEAAPKEHIDKDLEKKVSESISDELPTLAKKLATKEVGYEGIDDLKATLKEEFEEADPAVISDLVEKMLKDTIRKMILSGKRPDGRKTDELRDIGVEVGVLPRTHGSAIFSRGQTQAMTVATLGSAAMEQLIESAEGEESKRYIHHYSMPPYSVGETGRMGSPSRREIGHGALAERAIEPVLPSEDKFPYTIRVVSEILSSNGSTSMASTCGSTLSLMDAGVPIKAPVGGIAMGLVIDSSSKAKKNGHVVLTDIAGIEDGMGDMDFKVAGTEEGITALQLDVKTLELVPGILGEAFEQARKARLEILSEMTKVISEPRDKVSSWAPKIKVIKIDREKIGELIGPGGKTIKGIIAETGAQVDVEDDGTVSISGVNGDGVEDAVAKVEALTKDVEPGEIYTGEVKRIQPFGAFIEILPGKDGMVHVSDMSEDYVKDPSDIVSVGDEVEVRVKEIDDLGRINLTMILDPSKEKKKRGGGSGSGGSERPRKGGWQPRSRGRDDRRNKGRSDRRGGQSSGGPHFPASRLLNDDKNKKFSR